MGNTWRGTAIHGQYMVRGGGWRSRSEAHLMAQETLGSKALACHSRVTHASLTRHSRVSSAPKPTDAHA
jgi:hypothetical protein